jgi:hypothetical protein
LLPLEAKLGRVGEVLVLAAAAFAEKLARWLHAFARTNNQAYELCSRKPLLHLRDFRFNHLTRRNKRNKDDEIIQPRQTLAAKRDVADCQRQPIAGSWNYARQAKRFCNNCASSWPFKPSRQSNAESRAMPLPLKLLEPVVAAFILLDQILVQQRRQWRIRPVGVFLKNRPLQCLTCDFTSRQETLWTAFEQVHDRQFLITHNACF